MWKRGGLTPEDEAQDDDGVAAGLDCEGSQEPEEDPTHHLVPGGRC